MRATSAQNTPIKWNMENSENLSGISVRIEVSRDIVINMEIKMENEF